MIWQTAFQKAVSGKIMLDAPMSRHTSMGVGGMCDVLFMPESIEDLCAALIFLKENEISYYTLGHGTNIIVRDGGIRGVVIKMQGGIKCAECTARCAEAGMNELEAIDDRVRVGAGISLMGLIRNLSHRNICGLEELSGIPGTVGGAVWMNAGAFGMYIAQRIIVVTTVDENGRIKKYAAADCCFAYRTSIFQQLPREIIVEAELQMNDEKKELIDEKMREVLEKRREKHPQGTRSAGSAFKNPPGMSAGKLIEDAGLKGYRCGGAMVSEKHANFIINTGGATCDQILELIGIVRDGVESKFGVTLELEVQVIP
ncbi:MAG: UDP-N-acetylmuramate dehydrogenase [bacterium]